MKGFFLTKKVKKENSDISPLLIIQNEPFSKIFYRLLCFHLPEGGRVLDPTCGKEKHSWEYYFYTSRSAHLVTPSPKFNVLFSDSQDFGQDIVSDVLDLPKLDLGKFDAIFFDPPYVFDVSSSTDTREGSYGYYHGTFSLLRNLVKNCSKVFYELLTEKGFLFLKCTDVFSVKQNKLFHSSLLTKELEDFEIVNLSIVQYHNINPTAWQVKNRTSWITNYTILYVLKKYQEPKHEEIMKLRKRSSND